MQTMKSYSQSRTIGHQQEE